MDTNPNTPTTTTTTPNPTQQQQQAQSSYPPTQSSVPAPPFHHLLQQQQQQLQQLQMFWTYQSHDIEQVNDFKNHQLPLARIKKIMKADEDVCMISAEAPVLFAKACELTIRSWLHAEENKRRTLQKNDIAAAITRTDIFDFLVDIVPRDEIKDEAVGLGGMVDIFDFLVDIQPLLLPPFTMNTHKPKTKNPERVLVPRNGSLFESGLRVCGKREGFEGASYHI
ncbi:hypothetical protein ACE6H2_015807 [Prunus campanulata]